MKKIILPFLICILAVQSFAQLTIEKIWKEYTYYPFSMEIQNAADNNSFYFLYQNMLLQSSYNEKDFAPFVTFPNELHVDDFILNYDDTEILLATKTENLRRSSYKSVFYEYNINTGNYVPLFDTVSLLQYPQYSHNNMSVCFYFDNNLYVKSAGNIKQITHDGKKNFIINGMPDWVYEEEFEMTHAFEWSYNDTKIAYIQFDEAEVPEYQIPFYGGVRPDYSVFKYPKVGDEVSKVALKVYNVVSEKTDVITLPDSCDMTYIPEFSWVNESTVAITTLDRKQKHLSIYAYNCETQKLTYLYSYKAETYADIPTNFTAINGIDSFVVTDDRSGFNALYLYSNGKSQQLTNGVGLVTHVFGFSPKHNAVFFQATGGDPKERKVYKVALNGKVEPIFDKKGTNNATFNSDFSYCMYEYSNAKQELDYIICSADGKRKYELLTYDAFQKEHNQMGFTPKEFVTIRTDDGVNLEVSIIKPHDFDKNKRYPVIMNVYGGPTTQKVLNDRSYDYYWHQYLAQNGYIVVSVDPRGVYGKNTNFSKKPTYLHLGDIEAADFVSTAKYLSGLSYVDSSKIAIEGWSYGGYISLFTVGKYPNIFKTAVAIAPVTDWTYYDAIYTERYMQTYNNNPEGYENSSVFKYVEDIKAHILLVHGLADDNVHPQNTIEFSRALIDNNVMHETVFFPNDNHSLFGQNSRYYLYTKVFAFYETYLK